MQWRRPKTSKQRQRRPGWNTSACCARPVRCRKTVSSLRAQSRRQKRWLQKRATFYWPPQFAAIPPERLYPRVLPTLESIAACEAANIPHRNIIAMQGPFSFALNQAMMEQFHIRWLVTKDGGAAGGFDEKAAAASAAGAQLVVIRRPPEQGETAFEVLKRCKEMIR